MNYREYQTSIMQYHGEDEIVIMKGIWQDKAGAMRDVSVIEKQLKSNQFITVTERVYTYREIYKS